GHKVTLLCFMPDGNGHADLFVVDRTRFRDFTPSETAQFAKADGMSSAVWRRGGKTYLLAGAMDEPELRKLLLTQRIFEDDFWSAKLTCAPSWIVTTQNQCLVCKSTISE